MPSTKSKYLFNITLIAALIVLCQSVDFFLLRAEFASLNSNMVFGLFAINVAALAVASLFVILLGIISTRLNNHALWITFGGAVSNIIDRLIYGGTIDYIKLPFWPMFNLADLFIVAGLLLFAYSALRSNPQTNA